MPVERLDLNGHQKDRRRPRVTNPMI
jgi:hypothetical protein